MLMSQWSICFVENNENCSFFYYTQSNSKFNYIMSKTIKKEKKNKNKNYMAAILKYL